MRLPGNRFENAVKAAILAVALLCAAAPYLGANTDTGNRPFVGVWKLNVEKSKLHVPPGEFARYRQYEDPGNGWMFHTIINITARGTSFTFAAARYDGRQYPVYTTETLGRYLSDGTKPPRTVEFRRVDANNIQWTDRMNGKVVAGGTCTVSRDGNTLTITAKAPGGENGETVEVFDRQSAAAQTSGPPTH